MQFSPAAGRAGRCRQRSLCGEHSPCSGHTVFAPHRGVCAFPVYTAQAPGCSVWSGPCIECGSSFRVLHKSADSVAPAFCVFPGLSGSGSQRLGRPLPGCGAPFPSAESGSGSQRLGRTFPGCGAPFTSAASGPGSQRFGAFSLRGPGARRRSGLRKSLDKNRGLFAGREGVASLGLSFPLSPPPCLLPPAGMGRLFSGVSQSLCFVNRRQCVRLVNFLPSYPTV